MSAGLKFSRHLPVSARANLSTASRWNKNLLVQKDKEMFSRVAHALPVAGHARFYILYGEGGEDVFVNNNYYELNIEQAIQTELKSQGYRRIIFSAPHRPIFFLDQRSESLTWHPSPQTNRAS